MASLALNSPFLLCPVNMPNRIAPGAPVSIDAVAQEGTPQRSTLQQAVSALAEAAPLVSDKERIESISKRIASLERLLSQPSQRGGAVSLDDQHYRREHLRELIRNYDRLQQLKPEWNHVPRIVELLTCFVNWTMDLADQYSKEYPEVRGFVHQMRQWDSVFDGADPVLMLERVESITEFYEQHTDIRIECLDALKRLIDLTNDKQLEKYLIVSQQTCVHLALLRLHALYDLFIVRLKYKKTAVLDPGDLPVVAQLVESQAAKFRHLLIVMKRQPGLISPANYKKVMQGELLSVTEQITRIAARLTVEYLELEHQEASPDEEGFDYALSDLLSQHAWMVADAFHKIRDAFELPYDSTVGGSRLGRHVKFDWAVAKGVLAVQSAFELSLDELDSRMSISELWVQKSPPSTQVAQSNPQSAFEQGQVAPTEVPLPPVALTSERTEGAAGVRAQVAPDPLRQIKQDVARLLDDPTLPRLERLFDAARNDGPEAALSNARVLGQRASQKILAIDSVKRRFSAIKEEGQSLQADDLAELDAQLKTLDTLRKSLSSWRQRVGSEIFKYDMYKQQTLPSSAQLRDMLQWGQVDSIAFEGSLPSQNDRVDEYKIQYKPCSDGTVAKPVWLHIHCAADVAVQHALLLPFKQLRAAHLKSDQQRLLGAKWEHAAKANWRVDARVYRSPASQELLDLIKPIVRRSLSRRAD